MRWFDIQLSVENAAAVMILIKSSATIARQII